MKRLGRPSGFVMLAGLGLMLAVGLSLIWGLIFSGALAEKARSKNLADSAALASAGWFAQALNYQAYANRAIAANEIMVAQSLTLLSWVKHARSLSENSSLIASVVPALQPVASFIRQTGQAAHLSTLAASSLEVPYRSAYAHALLRSQEAMHTLVSPFSTQSLVNELIWSADDRYFGQYLPSSDVVRFYHAVETQSGARRHPFSGWVSSGLDQWARSRGYDQRLYLLPTGGCVPTSFDKLFSKLIRRGGTGLTGDLSSWQSADTLSIHTWRRRSRWWPTCSGIGESIPISWGASNADLVSREGLQDFGGNRANPGAFSRAESGQDFIAGYLGFPAHRDFKSQAAEETRRGFRIPVLVRLETKKSKVLSRLDGLAQNSPTAKTAPLKAAWTLSVARAELRLPRQADLAGSANLSGLFLPFWTAVLVPPNAADLAAAELAAQRLEN